MGNVLSPRKKAIAPGSAVTNTLEAEPVATKTNDQKEDVGFRPTEKNSAGKSVDVIIPATPIAKDLPSITSVTLTVSDTPVIESVMPAAEPVVPAAEPVVPAAEPLVPAAEHVVAAIDLTMPDTDFSPFLTDFNSPFVGDVTYLSTMVSAPTPSIASSPPISPLLITTYATASTDDSIHINMDDVD